MSIKFDPQLVMAVQNAYEKMVTPDGNHKTEFSLRTDRVIKARHELYMKEKSASVQLANLRAEADPKAKIHTVSEGDKFTRMFTLDEKEELKEAEARLKEEEQNENNFKFILRDN